MQDLKNKMLDCTDCNLCNTRNSVVFGEGSSNPLFMIVGEAPGEEEDNIGVPFVGKAGKKLDNILSYVGVDRNEIYITNAVLCRPPNNRNPNQVELDACKARLDKQIQILRPPLIIALGRIAMQQLQGSTFKGALSQFFPENIKEEWLEYQIKDHTAKVMVSYHPAYHLRSPDRAYKTTLPHWTMIKEWVTNQKKLNV
jgi:DNA polymerase